MTDAVLDAGPLIHLAELDALDLLQDLEGLFAAESVCEEVARYQPRVFQGGRIQIQRVAALTPSAELMVLARALALDRGEIDSLSLMERHPTAWFLTDDAAARLAGEQRGYLVHGTIGLLVRSVRRGQRSANDALSLLRTLRERSTLFIRPALLDGIIEMLETEWSNQL